MISFLQKIRRRYQSTFDRKSTDCHSLPQGHYRTTQKDWERLAPYIKFRYNCVSQHLPKRGRVYELGCGIGVGLHHLALQNPRVRFYGFDISPEAVEFGKKHFRLKNLYLESIKDSRELAERLDSDAFLIALEVLEHLNDEELEFFKINTMKNISECVFSFPYNQQNIQGTDHLQSFDVYKIFEIFPGFETLFIRRGSIKFIGRWKRVPREYIRENLGIAGEDKSIGRIFNAT